MLSLPFFRSRNSNASLVAEPVVAHDDICLAKLLCVDLDGTLLQTDMLHESLHLLLKKSLLYLFLLPFWVMKGRASFKHEIARRVVVDPAILPYHKELICYLKAQRNSGRRLVLATACAKPIADIVARHLDIFDGVLASNKNYNLKGGNKAACLRLKFGEKGFSYAGNDSSDLAVWKYASSAIVVGNQSLANRAQKFAIIEKHFLSTR